MKARKAKATEPSLRERLSQSYLEAFEADFRAHGISVLEQLREKSPEKYAEIASRLIAASEPKPDGFENAKTMQEIGLRLLKSVGLSEEAITDERLRRRSKRMINSSRLAAIRDRRLNSNGNAAAISES